MEPSTNLPKRVRNVPLNIFRYFGCVRLAIYRSAGAKHCKHSSQGHGFCIDSPIPLGKPQFFFNGRSIKKDTPFHLNGTSIKRTFLRLPLVGLGKKRTEVISALVKVFFCFVFLFAFYSNE